MKFYIRYRLDSYPIFTTDFYIFEVSSWIEAFLELKSIEASGNSVIEIERIFDE